MKPLLVLPPAETLDVQYLLDGVPWKGLKCTAGGSRKYWRVRVAQRYMETWWGRIGTDGQHLVKAFGSHWEAFQAADELTREKFRKGYVIEPDGETPHIDWARMSPGDHMNFVQRYGPEAARAAAAKSQLASARPGYVQPGAERNWKEAGRGLETYANELKAEKEREDRARVAPVSLARFAALVPDQDGES